MESKAKAKISEDKLTTDILKTEFSNATYDLNKLLTNKRLKNDFLKKR